MTADLYTAALAAIEARRELVEAGNWPLTTVAPDEREYIGFNDEAGFFRTFKRDTWGNPNQDAALIVAAVNAFAADTDALAAVLERHGPMKPWPGSDGLACGQCARNNVWPCPDAQSALTALGVTS